MEKLEPGEWEQDPAAPPAAQHYVPTVAMPEEPPTQICPVGNKEGGPARGKTSSPAAKEPINRMDELREKKRRRKETTLAQGDRFTKCPLCLRIRHRDDFMVQPENMTTPLAGETGGTHHPTEEEYVKGLRDQLIRTQSKFAEDSSYYRKWVADDHTRKANL